MASVIQSSVGAYQVADDGRTVSISHTIDNPKKTKIISLAGIAQPGGVPKFIAAEIPQNPAWRHCSDREMLGRVVDCCQLSLNIMDAVILPKGITGGFSGNSRALFLNGAEGHMGSVTAQTGRRGTTLYWATPYQSAWSKAASLSAAVQAICQQTIGQEVG